MLVNRFIYFYVRFFDLMGSTPESIALSVAAMYIQTILLVVVRDNIA